MRKKRRKKLKKKKNSLSTLFLSAEQMPSQFFFTFILFFVFIYYYYYYYLLLLFLLYFWIYDSYCFIQVRFCPEIIYFFLVHFILNEFSPSHFPTSEIFVKISSLELLTTYHPKNRKNFRLSQNLMKFFWVNRFSETNLTVQSVSSSET